MADHTPLPALQTGSLDELNRMVLLINDAVAGQALTLAKIQGQDGMTATLSSDLDLAGHTIKNSGRATSDTDLLRVSDARENGLLSAPGQPLKTSKPIEAGGGVTVPNTPLNNNSAINLGALIGALGQLDATAAPPKVTDASDIGTNNGHIAREQHTHQGVNLDVAQYITGDKTFKNLYVQDQTAVTGVTFMRLRGGAGQGINPLFDVRDAANVVLGLFNWDGGYYSYAAGVAKVAVSPGTGLALASDRQLTWQDNVSLLAGAVDTVLKRKSAGVVEVNNQLAINGANTLDILIGSLVSSPTFAAISLANDLSNSNYNFAIDPAILDLYINRPTGKNIQFAENNSFVQLYIQGVTGNIGLGVTPGAGKSRLFFGGTAIATTDVALSGAWGASATVTAVTGTDNRGTITVTTNAADTPTANPLITLTFKDGTWTTVPFVMANMRGTGTGPLAAVACASTATMLTMRYIGTPTALSALTYILNFMVVG